MRSSRYADVFTVSEEEVVEYVLKNGIPENEQTNPNLLQKGFHFYKEDSKWHTFFYERSLHQIREGLPMILRPRHILTVR